MAQNFFISQSTIGIDLNNQSTTALFAVGTKCFGTQDTEWVYVQAATTIQGLTMVAYNAAFTCGMASATDVITGLHLATAQTSISNSAFGWVAIRGTNLTIKFTGTVSVGGSVQVQLGASAMPTGLLIGVTVGTASCTLQGVHVQATASDSGNSGNVAQFILSWPKAATVGVGG